MSGRNLVNLSLDVSRRLAMGLGGVTIALPNLIRPAHAQSSPETAKQLLIRLRDVVDGDGVLTGNAITSRYLARRQTEKPLAVVRPTTTQQISDVMRLCHAVGQVVVPQGGNSGLVRGATAGASDLILSVERMNQIEHISESNRTMTAGAGVILADAQAEALKRGFLLPLNMGSRAEAMLGGMVATNAGGEEVVRYGMTRDSVLGLEAVLADGTIISAMNRMIKNNAGYDLKHLFIGSEGTLGIVTRVVMRLRAQSTSVATALVAVNDHAAVQKLLRHCEEKLSGTLTSFEVMWADYDAFVRKYTPHLPSPLKSGAAYYIIVESHGSEPDADAVRFSKVVAAARSNKLVADFSIARDAQAREAIWALREQAGAAFSELGPFWGYDVSLPIDDMATFGAQVKSAVTAAYPDATMLFMGHVGDGNLHIIAAPGSREPAVKRAVDDIVYGAIRDVSGSVSAEHGIGLEKKDYLAWSRTPQEVALMRTLKTALDPTGILNPGKVL